MFGNVPSRLHLVHRLRRCSQSDAACVSVLTIPVVVDTVGFEQSTEVTDGWPIGPRLGVLLLRASSSRVILDDRNTLTSSNV